jgi:hypothetical protein
MDDATPPPPLPDIASPHPADPTLVVTRLRATPTADGGVEFEVTYTRVTRGDR